MADTAAIMTTSLFMNTISLAVKIRPDVLLLFPKGSNGIYPHARFQWYFE